MTAMLLGHWYLNTPTASGRPLEFSTTLTLVGQALEAVYPPPEFQPQCQCWPNLMKAFFCPHGHVTECHVGLDCGEAECSHLGRDT